MVHKSPKRLHGTSSCYAHVPADGDATKAVGSRTTIMKGLDHRSFAQFDCGDEENELCKFVQCLGPAPRQEHVMRYVVALSVVRAQMRLHMSSRDLYSVCVGACTHVNKANGVVNGAVRVTFHVEIPVRSPAITDDRSAGLELLGKIVQPCRSLPEASITAIKVSAVLSGTGTRNVLPDSRSTPPNTHCPSTGWRL